MGFTATPLERAFVLAKSGEYPTVSAVKLQLRAEGLSDQQITGPTLMRQLAALCKAAARAPEPGGEAAAPVRPDPDF